MKKLIVKDNVHGRTTKLNATSTHETYAGKWVAEVDENEFRQACFALCEGIKNCTCDNLHVEADEDDDGKEYIISKSKAAKVH